MTLATTRKRMGGRERPVDRLCAAFVLAMATTCEAPAASEADAGDPGAGDPGAGDPGVQVREAPVMPAPLALDRVDPSVAAPSAAVASAAADIANGSLDAVRARADAASPDDQGVIRFRLARAYESAGAVEAAVPLFEAVVVSGHPLALAARVEIGRIDPDAPRARHALEPACAEAWAGRAEACAIFGLRSLDAPDAEARLEEAYAARAELRFEDRSTIVRELASRLGAHDAVADRERAITILREHGALRPSSATTSDLDARASAIALTLPRDRRDALRELSPADSLARAESLSRMNAHAEAERIFHDVAHHTRATDPAHCPALLGEGRARYRRRARAEAAASLDEMDAACAGDVDSRAWGLYFAAKSYSALGQDVAAIARYDSLLEVAPTHRLADDALLEAGMIELRNGSLDAARARLGRLADLVGESDMRPDGLFVLAWTEREAGEPERALSVLDRALSEGVPESREDLGGRYAYWRARLLLDLGRADDARAAFLALATERPLSYYGRSARGRLEADALPARAEWPAAEAVTFALPEASEQAAYERALSALRAGETGLAERELSSLGWIGPSADPDRGWLVVALLSHAGAHERAVTRARGPLVRGLLSRPLDGRARALVGLAYPRGYADVIEPSAREASVDASLVFGIVREESSFAPSAVSIAHAYGLMQLIRPTAARLARPLGLSSDVDSLVRPEINVRLGSRYLGELSRRYAPGPEVVPAAYNAGQGAVDRWLRAGRSASLDEFVETIPYAETRGYTRRVLQSWGVYQFLATGEVAPMPSALPTLP